MESDDDNIPQATTSAKITTGINKFAAHLYKEVVKYSGDNNFVTSPYAIAVLLGLARIGSVDDTAQELANALYFSYNVQEFEDLINRIDPKLEQGRNFYYRWTNCYFLSKNTALKKEVMTSAEKVYKICLENIEFSRDRACVNTINDYIKTKIDYKIDKVIEEDNVQNSHKLLLINATYCKIKWLRPFQINKEEITKKNFTLKGGKTILTDFMEKTGTWGYAESKSLKASLLIIPLEYKLLDLILVLPNDVNGLDELEKKLEDVYEYSKFAEQRVTVYLPKIHMEFKIDLKKPLQHLGVKKAFKENADFGNFIAEKNVFFINDVVQKTVIIFQEDQESSTNIRKAGSSKRLQGQSKSFLCDHPFLFFIKSESVVINAGRIKNPS